MPVKEEFSKRRFRQIIATVIMLPFVIALAFVRNDQEILGIPSATVSVLGIVAIVGGLLFSFWNWRCPSCGWYLGRRINPSHCWKCKTELR